MPPIGKRCSVVLALAHSARHHRLTGRGSPRPCRRAGPGRRRRAPASARLPEGTGLALVAVPVALRGPAAGRQLDQVDAEHGLAEGVTARPLFPGFGVFLAAQVLALLWYFLGRRSPIGPGAIVGGQLSTTAARCRGNSPASSTCCRPTPPAALQQNVRISAFFPQAKYRTTLVRPIPSNSKIIAMRRV